MFTTFDAMATYHLEHSHIIAFVYHWHNIIIVATYLANTQFRWHLKITLMT